jgi:hypothetical protein
MNIKNTPKGIAINGSLDFKTILNPDVRILILGYV